MRKQWMAAALCAGGALCSSAAMAHGPRGGGGGYPNVGNNTVDIFAVPSADVDFNPGDDSGDGWGLKGAFQVSRDVFLIGEYQSVEYDDENRTLDQYRLGAAFGRGASNGDGFFGDVQYVNFDLENADGQDGIAGHVGFAVPLSPQFRLFGEVGYIGTDDFDGPEFIGGATFQFTPNVGLYADYRATRLEDDNDNNVDLDDFRIGARLIF